MFPTKATNFFGMVIVLSYQYIDCCYSKSTWYKLTATVIFKKYKYQDNLSHKNGLSYFCYH